MVVIGREKEYKLIKSKITKFLKDGISSTFYISGVPGSGKTHTLNVILNETDRSYIYINAGLIKSKSIIFKHIFDNISCLKNRTNTFLNSIQTHLMTCRSHHIIIIDEIDLLINKSQTILYNLFDLVYLENSKLALFLISNTMNLPEKMFESKLCSRIGKNRIDFKPYNHVQLRRILKVTTDLPDIELEILSRKISSISGDVRRAIHCSKNNLKVSLNCKILQMLSLYQKLIIFIILETTRTTPKNIYKKHSIFCKTKNFFNLEFFEFLDILEELNNLGIIKFKNWNQKISLLIYKEDIERALKYDEIFNNFT